MELHTRQGDASAYYAPHRQHCNASQHDHTGVAERTTKSRIHATSWNTEYPSDPDSIERVLRVEVEIAIPALTARLLLHVGQLKLAMQ